MQKKQNKTKMMTKYVFYNLVGLLLLFFYSLFLS